MSTDGCSAWSKVDSYLSDGWCLVRDPQDSDIVYAAGSRFSSSYGYQSCICRSTDAGATWNTRMHLGEWYVGSTTCYDLAIYSGDTSVLYTGGQQDRYVKLWRSKNGGGFWADATGDLSSFHEDLDRVYAVWITPDDANTVVVGTSDGVFCTSTGGINWSASNLTYPTRHLAYDDDNAVLYAATSGYGVFSSDNAGVSWQECNNGLGNLNILTLDIDKTNGILYVGTNGGSVWRLRMLDEHLLDVAPQEGLAASGLAGGPYAPACQYTLTNTDSELLEWACSCPCWVNVEPMGGTLGPGEFTDVSVCIGENATWLDAGLYNGDVVFTDLTNAIDKNRAVTLEIESPSAFSFVEGFEAGVLADCWDVTGTGECRAQISDSNSPHTGSYHLLLDDRVSAGSFSRNEVTLTIDLEDCSDVLLTFQARDFGDEPHGPPASPFSDGDDFDGVAISQDGNVWYEVQSLRDLSASYQQFTVDLDAAIAGYGLSYEPGFKIRFNQYDNYPIPTDGIAIDDIEITGYRDVDSRLYPDFNNGGTVGLRDFDILAQAMYSAKGDVTWNGLCDLNVDCSIDMLDIVRFVNDWLEGTLPADIDGDNFVSMVDFTRFSSCWQSSTGDADQQGQCDVNADGEVNIADVADFAHDWLRTPN